MHATYTLAVHSLLTSLHSWYAGALSERKAEKILAGKGVKGVFLVRKSLLPDVDYILSIK